MHKIIVDGITIHVKRKDIKHMYLSLRSPDGRVQVSTPKDIDDETVRSFVASKLSWIKRHLERFKKQNPLSPQKYVSGDGHYYRGKRYVLNVIYQSPPLPNQVRIRSEKYLDLYVRKGSLREQRKRILTEWYRERLKEMIPHLIEKWEKKIGVRINDWGVKRMKSKWGSCNITDKRVWVNLELARRSPLCLEYILVHELVHLLESHHNQKFNSYMDQLLPDWKSLNEELKKYPIKI